MAFCIDNLGVGGTELNAVRTAERLDRSRYPLEVVCMQPEGPLRERYEAAGIPLHPFPIRSLYGASALRQGALLARFLRDREIRVFHAHDKYSNIFGVPWARLAGSAVIASRRWSEGSLRRGHRIANRLAYRMADAVLANSERVGSLLQTSEGVPEERISVVPNFLDESAFQPPSPGERGRLRAELGIPPHARLLGIVANLRPVKDHASLLRAVGLLHPRWGDLHLVLVGDGECRPELQALARDLGISEHVHFAGRRGSHPNLHHLFDVSVLCSLSEGLSNSLLEAMAAARPIVATDVGAAADAVVDGETGFLVPPSDPPALSAAIERLLSDPVRARAMGEAGGARARERFSPERAIAALEALYLRVAARSRL